MNGSAHQPSSTEVLQLLNQEAPVFFSEHTGKIYGVIIGTFIGVDESGELLVDFPGNPSGRYLSAQSIVALNIVEAGRNIVLMFEAGDPLKPIIMGLLQPKPATTPTAPNTSEFHPQHMNNVFEVKTEGDRILFNAKSEIVFKCGKSSIVLTKAGKILLRGAYMLARSSGVNRIKGASVQIN